MTISTFAIGFYVMDEVGRAGVLSGPFDNPGNADTDKNERSIGDDCGVWHRNAAGRFYPYPGYSVVAE